MAFTKIVKDDKVKADVAMSNWTNGNYGTALNPVDANGTPVNATVNLGSSGAHWKDVYSKGDIHIDGGFLLGGDNDGDMYFRDKGKLSILPKGATGESLISAGAGKAPVWSSVSKITPTYSTGWVSVGSSGSAFYGTFSGIIKLTSSVQISCTVGANHLYGGVRRFIISTATAEVFSSGGIYIGLVTNPTTRLFWSKASESSPIGAMPNLNSAGTAATGGASSMLANGSFKIDILQI